MSLRGRFACVACGRDGGALRVAYACPCERASNLRVETRVDGGGRAAFLASLAGRDLWRYQALLPVARAFGSTLAVGGTPLYDCGLVDGVQLYLKDDTRNPSGSLKDRATDVALAVARAEGMTEVVAASTGNAAASLACIAAAQNMKATILVPRAAPPAKLAQIRAYGAKIIAVDGSYDDAFACAVALARRDGLYCRNTGYNPFVREGKKTAALEIAEQLGWQAPDWVALPCGDGSIVASIHKGFDELRRRGVIDAVPRLIAAQAASSNSIGQGLAAARRGAAIPPAPTATPDTIADSIAVARPRDYEAAVQALLASRGLAVALDDTEIRAATLALARRFGAFVEPASGAAWAAVQRLLADGSLAPGARVVVVLTGTGLKDPFSCTGPHAAIDADAVLDPATLLGAAGAAGAVV